MSNRLTKVSILSAVLWGAACSGSEPVPDRPAAVDGPREWRLVEDLRIGSLDDGAYALDSNFDLAIGPNHSILVAHRRLSEVRVFDRSGTYVRTIGGIGEGPGEMNTPNGIRTYPDGSLLVADPNLGRYTVFDSAGEVLDTYRREISGVCLTGEKTVFLSHDGTVFDARAELVFGADGARFDPACELVQMDSAFGPTDRRIGLKDPTDRTGPYFGTVIAELDPRTGTLWSGDPHTYRIYRYRLGGDTLATIARDLPALPVTEADIDRLVESSNAERAKVGWGPMDVPANVVESKPFFSNLSVDPVTGHLWVTRVGEVDGEATEFDVFDESGRYLGTARTEVRLHVRNLSGGGSVDHAMPIRVRDGYVYGGFSSEVGAPFIVRLRMEPSG